MSIAPIIQIVDVKAPPARAFDLFAAHMSLWWPKNGTPAAQPHERIVIEPRAGGRFYEVDADGNETVWGAVLAWEPPGRLLIDWQLGEGWKYDPALHTDVELSFEPRADGGTRVTLTHSRLENFGANAEARATQLRGGWPTRVADYANFVNAQD